MLLPIPLCAFHNDGWSGSDSFGQTCRVRSAFIGWEDTKELSTFEAHDGLRIGKQQGRYGAYIDASSVNLYRCYNWKGYAEVVNGAPATATGLPGPRQTSKKYCAIPCTTCWFDGEAYITCFGYVRLVLSWRTVDGTSYARIVKQKGYSGVYIRTFARLSATAFQHLVDTYTPGNLWQWPKTRRVKKNPLCDQFLYEDDRLVEDPRELYDTNKVNDIFTEAARVLWLGETDYIDSMSYQPVYPARGDLYPFVKAIPTLLHTYEFSDPQLANGRVGACTQYRTRQVREQNALTHEWNDTTAQQLVCRGGPYGTYLFEWLVQHAWMDAANSIPQANQNSIQNLQAAFELLAKLRSGNVAEIPEILYKDWVEWTSSASNVAKGWANVWLRYRYELSTTRMDIEEYVKFGLNIVDKYMQQIVSSRTHGHASYQGIECNCSMTWTEKGLTGLSRFFHDLWKTGLEPNAYVVWDYVPFSFVVDWFTPAGDVLETYSQKQFRNSAYYEFSDIVFSIRYRTGPIAGMYAEHFVRWVAETPPIVDESYWFDDGGATTGLTTKVKRVLDSGSLMTGIFIK